MAKARKISSGDHARSEVWEDPELVEAIRVEQRRLGQRLRTLRQAAGWTQEVAAEKAHLHPIHLSRLESGAINISLASLVSLSRAYGVQVAALFQPEEVVQKS